LKYLTRLIESVLVKQFRESPVLTLTGARQTDKRTLAQRLPGAGRRRYRTLDDIENLDLAQTAPDTLISDREPIRLHEVRTRHATRVSPRPQPTAT